MVEVIIVIRFQIFFRKENLSSFYIFKSKKYKFIFIAEKLILSFFLKIYNILIYIYIYIYIVEPASYTLDLINNIHSKIYIDYLFL